MSMFKDRPERLTGKLDILHNNGHFGGIFADGNGELHVFIANRRDVFEI